MKHKTKHRRTKKCVKRRDEDVWTRRKCVFSDETEKKKFEKDRRERNLEEYDNNGGKLEIN